MAPQNTPPPTQTQTPPPHTSPQLLVSFPAEHVLLLTLNRPEQMNAMTPGMQDDLRRVLNWFEEEASLWVVIVTGAGRVFCAGADLKAAWSAASDDIDSAGATRKATMFHRRLGSRTPRSTPPSHTICFLPIASASTGSAQCGTSILLQMIAKLGKAKPTPISGRAQGSVKVERSRTRRIGSNGGAWNTDQQTGVSNEQESVVSNIYGFGSISRRHSKKPIIAAVNGKGAYGGGMEMVLNCDYVVAGEEARFALPEVKRGVIAVQGGVKKNLLYRNLCHSSLGNVIFWIPFANSIGFRDPEAQPDCWTSRTSTMSFPSILPRVRTHSLDVPSLPYPSLPMAFASPPPPNGTRTPSGFRPRFYLADLTLRPLTCDVPSWP
ncbi:hypothetical protein NMY22_g12980 [Coprinellus aureogranulatus]|nr:hypothetical protein NMY22_g12980 [Coprinellus aureogranulatus]